jgi:hypothetical protein
MNGQRCEMLETRPCVSRTWVSIIILLQTPGQTISVAPTDVLVPELQHTIEIARDDLGRLPRMPLHGQDGRITRLDLVPHLARLPVPETHVASAVSGADELSIRTDGNIRRVPSNVVALVALLSVLPESLWGGIDGDLVVRGLHRNVFSRGMRSCADHGEHVRLGDELDGYGNAVFPRAEGLVVRGGDKSTVLQILSV